MRTPKQSASRDARRIARAEAAAWIVRLHGPQRSPELEEGFRSWLASDPENGRQFERVTDVWEAGSTPVPGVPRLRSWPTARPVRGWMAMAAVLVAVIGLGVWVAHRFLIDPSYATGIGEQRIVRLDDGSRLSLNSNTRVSVSYGATERRLRIESGEAYFEVAPNRARPFIVIAGDRRVTAVGTAFAVRYEPDRTAITLVEGRVAVSAATPKVSISPQGSEQPETPREPFLMRAGERLTFEGAVAKLDTPPTDAMIAWRRGEVMLDKTTLADAVAEMNRYDDVTLVIDDPSIAGLRVSGVYHTGDSDGFARTMARLHRLEVTRQEGRIYLRSSAAGTQQSDVR